ncbi:MAG: hypothetical protein A2138_20320, partial [Deltaproteobacteria bacterium RBG_16_71_12]
DEERGKSGMARLFEHLMYQGSKHSPGDNHVKLLEGVGASAIGGTAAFDYTSYFACVPKNEIELALWLEADRMAWVMDVAEPSKIEEQRKIIAAERRRLVDDRPYAAAREALWQAIFPADHPYRAGLLGASAELDKLALADVQTFFDRHYSPANATLVISGDITVEDARKLADKYFRSIPKAAVPSKRTVPMPTLGAEVRVDLEDRLAQLTVVTVAFFAPPAFQNGSADIEVLAHLLGDGNASRLHQALVVDGKLAQSVRAGVVATANVSVVELEVKVRPGVNPDDVLNAIQAQLALLQDLPPSTEELARAVAAFEARRLSSLQRPLGRAELLQTYRLFAGDAGFLPKDLARYRAVTPDSVLAAVNGFLTKERRAVAVVRPAGAAPKEPAPAPASEVPSAAPATTKEGG